MRRGLAWGLVVTGLAAAIVPALAGVIRVPCDSIPVFPGADVHVVVLPPDFAPLGASPPPLSQGIRDLALVLQSRVLHSIAPLGRVASVHLVRRPSGAPCTPERVHEALMEPGPAPHQIAAGRGLVLLWSVVTEDDEGELWLRSFARFARRDRDERVGVRVDGRPFTLQPSTQTLALPAQTVDVARIGHLRRTGERLLRLHEGPDTRARLVEMPALLDPETTLSFEVLQTLPGWMQVRMMATQQVGWMQIGDPGAPDPTTELLPEVDMVTLVAAYLRDRVDMELGRQPPPARLALARAALERYLAHETSVQEPATAACGEQLLALMEQFRAGDGTEGTERVAGLLERAATRLPLSGRAQGNAAIARLKADFTRSRAVSAPRDIEARLSRSLTLDPGDERAVGNLESFYRQAPSTLQHGAVRPEQRLTTERIQAGLAKVEVRRIGRAPGPPRPPVPPLQPQPAPAQEVTEADVLAFLNRAGPGELREAGIEAGVAERIVATRPFTTLDQAARRLGLGAAATKALVAGARDRLHRGR
jgi:hypothetical protein